MLGYAVLVMIENFDCRITSLYTDVIGRQLRVRLDGDVLWGVWLGHRLLIARCLLVVSCRRGRYVVDLIALCLVGLRGGMRRR